MNFLSCTELVHWLFITLNTENDVPFEDTMIPVLGTEKKKIPITLEEIKLKAKMKNLS